MFYRNLIKEIYYNITYPYYHSIRKIENYPKIIVLGNQKSGSSAIANLIAEYSDISRTIDIPEFIQYQSKIIKGEKNFSSFIKKYPYRFSKYLLKDNHFSFYINDVEQCFPDSYILFVMRHPLDNIRSILDRVNMSGTDIIQSFNYIENKIEPNWKPILSNEFLPQISNKLLLYEGLAIRWKVAAQLYLKSKNKAQLVKYEEFDKNKMKTIQNICNLLNLKEKRDITPKLDYNFQQKGKNRNKNIIEFFDKEIIEKVEALCEEEMRELGYSFYSELY